MRAGHRWRRWWLKWWQRMAIVSPQAGLGHRLPGLYSIVLTQVWRHLFPWSNVREFGQVTGGRVVITEIDFKWQGTQGWTAVKYSSREWRVESGEWLHARAARLTPQEDAGPTCGWDQGHWVRSLLPDCWILFFAWKRRELVCLLFDGMFLGRNFGNGKSFS